MTDEIHEVKAKGLKNQTKKEIEWIFSYFGPLETITYNGMSGKATIKYDMKKFWEESNPYYQKFDNN